MPEPVGGHTNNRPRRVLACDFGGDDDASDDDKDGTTTTTTKIPSDD